jgi:phage shock protein A
MVVDSANSARLRLLRLSDAADKLRRQAAISVQTGKENDARQLLLQKKKVILALEKSKRRIELLDELSAKLNEVE